MGCSYCKSVSNKFLSFHPHASSHSYRTAPFIYKVIPALTKSGLISQKLDSLLGLQTLLSSQLKWQSRWITLLVSKTQHVQHDIHTDSVSHDLFSSRSILYSGRIQHISVIKKYLSLLLSLILAIAGTTNVTLLIKAGKARDCSYFPPSVLAPAVAILLEDHVNHLFKQPIARAFDRSIKHLINQSNQSISPW